MSPPSPSPVEITSIVHPAPTTPLIESLWPSSAWWRRPECSDWWWYQTCWDRRSQWSCSPSPHSLQCRRPWPGSLPPQTPARWSRAPWTRRELKRGRMLSLWFWWSHKKKNWSIRATMSRCSVKERKELAGDGKAQECKWVRDWVCELGHGNRGHGCYFFSLSISIFFL